MKYYSFEWNLEQRILLSSSNNGADNQNSLLRFS